MNDLAAPAVVPPASYCASPAEELGVLVSWGAAAFYWAEAGANPMVRTYWDALHYIATSLSVGYANFFPVTAIGKTVGSLVMTIGPAMSARALDQNRPAAEAPAADGTAVLAAKLDAIIAELRHLNAG